MPVLLLAVDIADAVAKADREFDYRAKAAELLARHPEASVGRDAVAEALQQEYTAVAIRYGAALDSRLATSGRSLFFR